MTTGGRVSRRVFREEVKDYLIAAILRRDLKPGDRIVETRIADVLGVSQAPVREALRELELLGFVESAPFRGAQVCDVSYEELGQLYPLRATVEAMAARAAATRIGPDELRALERLLEEMHDAARAGDTQAHVESDIAFHRIVVEASGSRLLRRFWDGMQLHATTFLTLAVTRRDLHELAERHASVLAALAAHDPVAAEEAVRRHIEEPGAWVADILRHASAPPDAAPSGASPSGDATSEESPRDTDTRPRIPGEAASSADRPARSNRGRTASRIHESPASAPRSRGARNGSGEAR